MLDRFIKMRQALRLWLSQPLGQALIAAEASVVSRQIATLFGHHLLMLGEPQFLTCLHNSPILHKVWIHPEVMPNVKGSPLTARQDKLPILSDEIDLVFLAHCLESIQNPHEVLREAYRVLKPEGYLVLTGFNPWSIWGIWCGLSRYIKRTSWDGNFISLSRIQDWLVLLGFNNIHVESCFFRPPISNMTILRRLHWLEKIGRWCWPLWGASYVIFAEKQVAGLTPIRPIWRKQKGLVTARLGEPAARVKSKV